MRMGMAWAGHISVSVRLLRFADSLPIHCRFTHHVDHVDNVAVDFDLLNLCCFIDSLTHCLVHSLTR